MSSFEEHFGARPEAVGSAPGRVNLLGEHTDYNDGLVLPAAIPMRMHVSMRIGATPGVRFHSADLGRTAEFSLDVPAADRFARYVQGCLVEARRIAGAMPPLDVHAASEVPMGVGLSSSAALEVATLRAVRSLLGLTFDDVTLARMAQRAEIEHAGVQCGLLDQMACSLLEPGTMLFLDTRTLERRLLPFPAGAELLVIDSGVPRTLADTKYNERRAQCAAAARLLGVETLRDAPADALDRSMPPHLLKRVRHVLSENARVREAITADAARLGRLMSASHASLSDDYEVSVPALDCLAALMQGDPDVFGAKLTGAGFGGACVGLCRTGQGTTCADRILRAYAAAGFRGRRLLPA